MTDMTEEEYDALDERWTQTTPKINFERPGVFARQRSLLEILDKVTANYIITRAEATNQTPPRLLAKWRIRKSRQGYKILVTRNGIEAARVADEPCAKAVGTAL
jgi:hypothetical protein